MSIQTRVAAVEKTLADLRGDPVIVVARLQDGTERELTVDEYISSGADFPPIEVRGNRVSDVKRILDTIQSCIDEE